MSKHTYTRNVRSRIQPFMRWHQIADYDVDMMQYVTACGLTFDMSHGAYDLAYVANSDAPRCTVKCNFDQE